MVLTNIEKIEDIILSSGIKLLKTNTSTVPISAVKIAEKKAIIYDPQKFKNSSEKFVALAHEYYHFNTNTLYCMTDSIQTRCWREYKANKQLILNVIQIDKLKKLLQGNYQRWEIAEEFGVTEETIDLAFEIYKNIGEL